MGGRVLELEKKRILRRFSGRFFDLMTTAVLKIQKKNPVLTCNLTIVLKLRFKCHALTSITVQWCTICLTLVPRLVRH
jgi:hypothetical protein